MSFFELDRRNQGTNNASIPGYAKFKLNARKFVNAYYSSPKNQTKNINAVLIANAHAFLNANPRQAARAGNAAGAAAAAGANQNVQTVVANAGMNTPPRSPPAVVATNVANAALNAGASVPQAAAAAAAAAAPPPPPPPPPPPRKPLPRTPNVNLLTGAPPSPANLMAGVARSAANGAAAMRTAKINRMIANLKNSTKRNTARATLNGYLSPNSNINNATRQRIRNALNAPPAQLPNIFTGNAGGPPPALNARINAFNKIIKEIQNANLNTANVANLNKRLNAARNALRNSGLASWNVGRQANYASWRGAINAAKAKPKPKN